MVKSHTSAIDPDDGEDADPRPAIAPSLQEQSSPMAKHAFSFQQKQSLNSTDNLVFSLRGLDRKRMEAERLQRLAQKRPHPVDDDHEVVEIQAPQERQTKYPKNDRSLSLQFFSHGVIKRTWCRGIPRTSEDIKFEEVVDADHLQLAILSSFQWDESWLLSKIDVRRTKLLLLAYASDETQKQAMAFNVPSQNIRFCFPPMNGPGAMHSKLQLLKYTDRLRVVVPSGNLVPYDWGETGTMENMLFIIDMPRLADPSPHQPTAFCDELCYFLRRAGVDEKMVLSLSNYDFTHTSSLGFVHSGHFDEAMKRTGYCGLGTTVSRLGFNTSKPVDIDMACASLGALKTDLIMAFYYACQGGDGMKEFGERSTGKNKYGRAKELADRFRIYFPTHETVASSRGGKAAGGTICLQSTWWRASTFPRELIRDCVNTRPGILMHSKVIYVRQLPAADGEQKQCTGWGYVGSANLSESAWGRIVKDRATGKMKISCRNWECGVIIPLPQTKLPEEDEAAEASKSSPLPGFQGTMPVPMQVPGQAVAGEEKRLAMRMRKPPS